MTQPPDWRRYPQPGIGPPSPMNLPPAYAAPANSGIAIAAMVVGICSIVLFFIPLLPGLVAIILGLIGIAQTGPNGRGGRAFAIAGIATGACGLVLSLLIIGSILHPSLNRAREAANRIKCASNLRQIGQSLRQYAIDDPRGRFPPELAVLRMPDGTPLDPGLFVCPSSNIAAGNSGQPPVPGQNSSYFYIGGTLTDSAPSAAVLMYEPVENHGREGANFLYVDGSVRFIPRQQARAMIQDLEQGLNPPQQAATPGAGADEDDDPDDY